jgi:serine/threonine protein kinase
LVIDRKGHLKLTDFGLSEFRVNQKLNESRKAEENKKRDRSGVRSNRKRRTALLGVNKQNMKLIGTPDYIAP